MALSNAFNAHMLSLFTSVIVAANGQGDRTVVVSQRIATGASDACRIYRRPR